jgi:hypothetical protein
VFVGIHVDAFSVEVDTFHFEALALFGCGSPAEFDLAACAEDTVPREYVGWIGA